MHDRRDAGHEECTTGGMHNMRNALQGGGGRTEAMGRMLGVAPPTLLL